MNTLAARFLFVLALVSAAEAAVVQGTVLDLESGAPLARATVTLIPVEGNTAKPVKVFTAERGNFVILSVAPGWYLLRAEKKMFAVGEAGQSRAGRPGHPFYVEKPDQSFFLEMRLTRQGAVSGQVVDENGVGIPEWPVYLYTSKKPIRQVAKGRTDDRGNFRVYDLSAGTYLARSGPGVLEDNTSLLASYHRTGTNVLDALPVPVRLGSTEPDLRIQPVKGRLLTLRGYIPDPNVQRATLITELDRRSLNMPSFEIGQVPPGPIEILVEGYSAGVRCAGYVAMDVDRDLYNITIPCQPMFPNRVFYAGVKTLPIGSLWYRRVDLDVISDAKALNSQDTLAPGKYQFQFRTVSDDLWMKGIRAGIKEGEYADGWFNLEVAPSQLLTCDIRTGATVISGMVTLDQSAAIGVPVYLGEYDETGTKRLRFIETRTDITGHYKFARLRPGTYRVLSSFDFDSEDRFVMERESLVVMKETEKAVKDLVLQP